MAKSFDALDDTFDITPVETAKPIKKVKPIIEIDRNGDVEKDYTYARAQLYNIVEKMSEAVSGGQDVSPYIQVSQVSEMPEVKQPGYSVHTMSPGGYITLTDMKS